MTRPVLITGATGFLGRALVKELALHGYEVHALVRETSDRKPLADLDPVWHVGDLDDPASIDEAVGAVCARAAELDGESDDPEAGAWIVNNAALVSYRTEDGPRQQAVNVEGTRAVLDAASRCGAQRVLHVSSVVTVGHTTSDAALDEFAEWNGESLGVDYVSTKRAAEEIALQFAEKLDLRVINPGAIFGPGGSQANTTRFVVSVARGELGPVAPPGGMSVVGVADVARGARLALEVGHRGRRYILSDAYFSVRELALLVSRVLAMQGLETSTPRCTAPAALWPAAVWGARQVERRRKLKYATPQALRMVGLRWRTSSARARRELGWHPIPFEKVLGETIQHLLASGQIP